MNRFCTGSVTSANRRKLIKNIGSWAQILPSIPSFSSAFHPLLSLSLLSLPFCSFPLYPNLLFLSLLTGVRVTKLEITGAYR
jgi:hypothetical protein